MAWCLIKKHRGYFTFTLTLLFGFLLNCLKTNETNVTNGSTVWIKRLHRTGWLVNCIKEMKKVEGKVVHQDVL